MTVVLKSNEFRAETRRAANHEEMPKHRGNMEIILNRIALFTDEMYILGGNKMVTFSDLLNGSGNAMFWRRGRRQYRLGKHPLSQLHP